MLKLNMIIRLLKTVNCLKCKIGVTTYMCDGMIHHIFWQLGWFNLTFGLLWNMMNSINLRRLNLWYIKWFHPNVMKLTTFTKLDLRVKCMNFLSNQSPWSICYSLRFKIKIFKIFKTFFRCSIIMILTLDIYGLLC